jgi:hypothetical protein
MTVPVRIRIIKLRSFHKAVQLRCYKCGHASPLVRSHQPGSM